MNARPITDVQGSADHRRRRIDRVGIRDLRHPILVVDRDGVPQPAVGTFAMDVPLEHDKRGTHMSRFVEILHGWSEPISVESIGRLVREVTVRLGAAGGRVECRFLRFVRKKAPVSGIESTMDYAVALAAEHGEDGENTVVSVVVPVTSLCPCSKEISDYGAHNQRSHVTVHVTPRSLVSIDALIETVEAQASSQLYGILKRPDEKYVTERAYDHPKFVEDLVRDLATALDAREDLVRWRIEVENFESIHNHSAYAVIDGPARAR